MPKWIDHIVVRVKDINEALATYENKLGLKASKGPDASPEMGMTRAILPLGDDGRFIELAEPLGEGVHLVALAVDDLAEAKAEMQGNGARIIEAGTQVFVHPRDGHGVMYQLIERK